jgi:hypothetical protein
VGVAQAVISVRRLNGGTAMGNDLNSRVTIVDVKMPFVSMVIFMVKWALAAIPAFIILLVIFAFLTGLLTGPTNQVPTP